MRSLAYWGGDLDHVAPAGEAIGARATPTSLELCCETALDRRHRLDLEGPHRWRAFLAPLWEPLALARVARLLLPAVGEKWPVGFSYPFPDTKRNARLDSS